MNEELRRNIVIHKISTAQEMLLEIKSHIENGYYNTAMNRMYYACYYAASALLINIDISDVKRHATVRNLFNLHFIKTGVFNKKWGAFYSDVMDCRAAADYEEFKAFSKAETEEMYPEVVEFVKLISDKLITEK